MKQTKNLIDRKITGIYPIEKRKSKKQKEPLKALKNMLLRTS